MMQQSEKVADQTLFLYESIFSLLARVVAYLPLNLLLGALMSYLYALLHLGSIGDGAAIGIGLGFCIHKRRVLVIDPPNVFFAQAAPIRVGKCRPELLETLCNTNEIVSTRLHVYTLYSVLELWLMNGLKYKFSYKASRNEAERIQRQLKIKIS